MPLKLKYIHRQAIWQLLIIVLMLGIAIPSTAQTYVTGPITGTITNGSYFHNTSISIEPNTDIVPGPGQTVEFFIGCAPLNTSLSSDRNYIVTTIPRKNNYEAGVANGSGPSGSYTSCDVMQSIQYYDGLGRPSQTVQQKASPLGNDIVQPIEYDGYGREVKKYLPYPLVAVTGGGNYRTAAITEQNSFYTSPSPGVTAIPGAAFAKAVFEPSPLNRVQEQGAPGAPWQPGTRDANGGRTVVMEYLTNNNVAWDGGNPNNTSRLVKLYTATVNSNFSRTLANSGTYADSRLYVTVTKDENWMSGRAGTTEEYKDMLGRVILKRGYNQNGGTLERLSTYYVYDDLGNLAFVLPPEANPDNGLTSGSNQALLDNLCYQYRYDQRNRLIEKKIPAKGWEEVIYNKLDQAVFTQDAVQRAASLRSFTKYDGIGRVIMTGIETGHTATRSTVQAIVDAASGRPWEERVISSGFHDYSNTSLPGNTSTMQPLVVNYYTNTANITGLPAYAALGGTTSATTGLPVASKVAVLNPNGTYTAPVLWTRSFYDANGRSKVIYQQHYLAGSQHNNKYDRDTIAYNFNDQITRSARVHYVHSGTDTSRVETIVTDYEYDHMGRKTRTLMAVAKNSTALPASVVLNRLEYNEVGQLRKKGLHSTDGTNFLQDITYTYNERGWLRNLSSALFQEQLQYNTVSSGKQFNGNIAAQSWGTAAVPDTRNYAYLYDNINRLTSGVSSHNYAESGITYDMAGNIKTLQRTMAGTLVDNLSYAYLSGSDKTNMLYSINDVTGNNTGVKAGISAYSYDLNGNMLTDASKSLNLSYNLLNLPRTATVPAGTVSYTYDAAGSKLRKVASIGAGTTTEYIHGLQYAGTTVDFVQTEEGRIISLSGTPNYEYALKDHLGNTRVTFDSATGAGAPKQTDEYLPFGMDIPVGPVPSAKNKYLYNGKEVQEEFNQYDYGARFYDPVIARWTSVDPLAEKYSSLTPYNYTVNNPIRFIDPDGKDGMVTGSGTKDDPYTINANYYYIKGSLSESQIKGFNSAISEYNAMGSIEVKNADGSTSYVKTNFLSQEVESLDDAKSSAFSKENKFTDINGNERYMGNIVMSGEGESARELGSANNRYVYFNQSNISTALENGANEVNMSTGIAAHEIAHNLGAEHSDKTATMKQVFINNDQSQINPKGMTESYPSTSKQIMKVIFGRRDTRNSDPNSRVIQPGIYTKAP